MSDTRSNTPTIEQLRKLVTNRKLPKTARKSAAERIVTLEAQAQGPGATSDNRDAEEITDTHPSVLELTKPMNPVTEKLVTSVPSFGVILGPRSLADAKAIVRGRQTIHAWSSIRSFHLLSAPLA